MGDSDGFWPAWYPPRPVPRPRWEERQQLPLPSQLAEEFADRPLGSASAGESYAGGVPAPLRPLGRPEIPPPEWANMDPAEVAQLAAQAAANENAEPELDALSALKLAAGDVDEPEPWAPVDRSYVPAVPVAIPEWSEEERRAEQLALERQEAARRARVERALAEEQPAPYPPPQRECA